MTENNEFREAIREDIRRFDPHPNELRALADDLKKIADYREELEVEI